MILTYTTGKDPHPAEVEIRGFRAFKDWLWEMGVGIEREDRTMLASWAEAFRTLSAGHEGMMCFGISRGEVLTTLFIHSVKKSKIRDEQS
jgi:hypothetical protein